MNPDLGLTVHFMDGSKLSYGFPVQSANAAARQLKLEDFLKSPYLMVIADGVLTMFPVANIKAIQLPVGERAQGVALPKHVVTGAKLTRGDL